MSAMIGRTLSNRYEVLALIGEGSTATVYRARDKRLGRVVALKILLPHVRETARKRFEQEALSVAALNHPNIMAIYDRVNEGNLHYIVVELVDGAPLSDYVPSAPDQVVRLGRQIALALHYAHEHQIIHRDIKPANIQVTSDGQIKIMDMGLALPRDAKRVTTDGMIIGTPAYLSPEQAQGMTLDHRTDIYSLGVVLYELATGQLPFSSDDITALMLQHVRQAPPPLRLIDASLPQPLENTILKALEKNPAKRFQSAEAFAAALAAALPGSVSALDSTQPSAVVQPQASSSRAVIRVVVADDHAMLRGTLVNYLNERDEIMVVGEAGDGEVALEKVIALKPDVLLLDLNMPKKGGLDVLPLIRAQVPETRVLVLTGRDEDWYITQALRGGAHGYLLKASEGDSVIDAILRVRDGHLVLGQGVAEKVVTGMLSPRPDDSQLTDDERRVLLFVAGGLDNDGIAARLGWSMTDVIETLARSMDKMGAKDRHSAALTALRRGVIALDELHSL